MFQIERFGLFLILKVVLARRIEWTRHPRSPFISDWRITLIYLTIKAYLYEKRIDEAEACVDNASVINMFDVFLDLQFHRDIDNML